MRKVLVSWSSGKDSAWMLHALRQSPNIQVVGLLTTINEEYNRVAIHGTRRALLEMQAESCGIPLWPVMLPFPCCNDDYEDAMKETLTFSFSIPITMGEIVERENFLYQDCLAESKSVRIQT